MDRQRHMEPPPTTSRPSSGWKMATEKPPLVTPSASPPPLRRIAAAETSTRPRNTWVREDGVHNQDKSSSSNAGSSSSLLSTYHNRLSSSVPPPPPPQLASTKRAASRVGSTPKPGGFFSTNGLRSSSLSSHPSSGSSSLASGSKQQQQSSRQKSTTLDPIDIHKEREASIMRLLGAWSQLDRHVKRLDQDDIVHLGTGKIIKDNGILRGLRPVKFGDDAEEEGEEEGEDEDEEDEDEEEDQLDTLGEEDISEEELEIQVQAPNVEVAPASRDDPKDAEDLRAFLEVGKDIGTEPEDDDLDDDELVEELYEDTDVASSEVQSEGLHELDREEDEDELPVASSGGSDHAVPEESDDSEDELNCNWAEDEASIVIPVFKDEESAEPIDDNDDDSIEIIEPPLPPKAKQTPAEPSKIPKARSQLQLYTPPLSRSSEQTPPDNSYIYTTPPPSNLPPPDITPEIPITRSHVAKKATPAPPLPKSPLSKKKRSKSKTATTIPLASQPSAPLEEPLAPDATVVDGEDTPAPKKAIKMRAEVVIERRTPFPELKPPSISSRKTKSKSQPEPAPTLAPSSTAKPKPKPKPKSKSKKAKPVVENESREENVEKDVVVQSTERKPLSTLKARSPPSKESLKSKTALTETLFPSADEMESEVEFVTALEISPPASPRKRKRSSSGKAPEVPVVSRAVQENAVASSSKTKMTPSSEEDDSRTTKNSKDARRSVNQRSPRKKRPSKSRSRQPESHSESGTEDDEGDEGRRRYMYHSARSASYHPPPHGMYQHSQLHPMYAHPPPQPLPQMGSASASGSSARGFVPAPLPNHQAQYIVSQVMQQLSAMATGHWGPMPGMPPLPHPLSSPPQQDHGLYHGQPTHGRGPFTPTHQHHQFRRSKSKGPPPGYEGYNSHDGYGGNVYSTPQHHYGFPYMYNSDMSRGTAPPDTPEHALRSSSPMGDGEMGQGGGEGRKKVLVERSRSRGRRVSFKMMKSSRDASSDDQMEDAFSSSPLGKRRSNGKVSGSGSRSKGKGKGKGDAVPAKQRPPGRRRGRSPEEVQGSEEGEEEASGAEESSDETPFVRGQTPGPVIIPPATKTSSSGAKSAGRTR